MRINSDAAVFVRSFVLQRTSVNLPIKTLVLALGLGALVAVPPAAFSAPAQQGTPAKTAAVKKTVRKAAPKKASAKQAALRKNVKKKPRARYVKIRRAPSQATLAGLRETPDALSLGSSVAYAVDQDTGEELFSKNADVELPIASVTKLMTALVIAESGLPLNQKIRITREDYVRSRASSKIRSGMVMTRGAVLQAALMSSDNRAATALARTYPGGRRAFVQKMNETAERLGMEDSCFADPSGLDNRNHSTARDLAKLVSAAHEHESIREASTSPAARLKAGRYFLKLQTTNRLIGNPDWNIGIQKTGFTTAAGRCMVVQSEFADRRVVMVLLDSPNSAQRAADMQTMRRFVENESDINAQFAEARPYEIF